MYQLKLTFIFLISLQSFLKNIHLVLVETLSHEKVVKFLKPLCKTILI